MRISNMTKNQRQQLLNDMLFEYESNQHYFPVVEDLADIPAGHRGQALHINDHGNVTAYSCFKNGNTREIASRV